MKLQRLTGLEREKIDNEYKEIEALIKGIKEKFWLITSKIYEIIEKRIVRT